VPTLRMRSHAKRVDDRVGVESVHTRIVPRATPGSGPGIATCEL
jgi:hypothetical protein